jgi:hypothetical protein
MGQCSKLLAVHALQEFRLLALDPLYVIRVDSGQEVSCMKAATAPRHCQLLHLGAPNEVSKPRKPLRRALVLMPVEDTDRRA